MLNNMDLTLKNKDWGQFKLSSIFTIENCKCSKVADLQNGNMPYIGATNRNNGLMSFVKPVKKLKTKGIVSFLSVMVKGQLDSQYIKKKTL